MGYFKDEERGKAVYRTAARCKAVEIKVIDRRKPEPLPLEDLCKKRTLTQHTIIDMFGPETGIAGFSDFPCNQIVGSFC